MNEKILTPQELKSKQEQEDAKLLADYLARHPEPEIAQFENIIALFESTHSLEDLHLIIDLTPQEAPKNAIREPARVALIPIIALLNTLKKKTNISTEKYEELKEKCRRLSRAVGMINNNKVDHNR